MDFKKDIEQRGVQQPAANQQKPAVSGRRRSVGNKKLAWIVTVIVIVAIAVCGWMFVKNNAGVTSADIKKDSYQAVFLTNGQVYFGNLQSTSGDYISLSNIYYLQVDQAIQPGGEATDEKAAANADDSNVQLVKLGNELHGPEDKMQINSDQVLFWENLKSDSKVSEAITSYKE